MNSLIRSVRDGMNSHAYIFEGEKGLGKHNAARLFAAALTCADSAIAPCGACPSCVEAKADTNPDIIYVRPEGNKKSIGADDMRALENDAAIKPFNSRHKVYIFEDGSLLTEAAQNVFLKTFEEPPSYAVFIIVIENSQLLLQTILSRFTLVHFPRLTDGEMEKLIAERYPDEPEEFLVKFSEGNPLTLDMAVNDAEFRELREKALGAMEPLISSDRKSVFETADFLDENKDNAEKIFNLWLSFLRDMLLIGSGAYEEITNTDKSDALRRLAARISPEKTAKLMRLLVKAEKMLSRYVKCRAISLWIGLNS